MARSGGPLPRLWWISPGEGVGPALVQRLAACVAGGLRAFQLREKGSFARTLLEAAGELRRVLPRGKGFVLVNDRVDVALAGDLDGVHLGGASLPVGVARRLLGHEAWIGRSVHDEGELALAVEGGADFVFASPVFPVRKAGRPASAPLGLVGLRSLVRRSPLPVFGLGGITAENLGEVLAAGAYGVAVMRTLAGAADPRQAVADLLERLP